MLVFWILAAGLVGIALVFVLAPLLRKPRIQSDKNSSELNRTLFEQQLAELKTDLAAGNLDQAQYDAARRDLERQLLYDLTASEEAVPSQTARSGRWAVGILAVAVPTVSVLLYTALGNLEIIPRLEAQGTVQAGRSGTAQPPSDLPPMEVLVERLAAKLEQDPSNLEGWLMLGRSYAATGQAEKSVAAFKRAYDMAPNSPDVMLAYAETLAAQNANRLEGEPETLIQKALDLSPQNPSGLWLAGVAALQRGDGEAAAKRWEALYQLLPPEGEDAAKLKGFIAQARGESDRPGGPSTPAAGQAPEGPTTEGDYPAGTSSIQVKVELAEHLASRASPEHALFVYAKALDGPPMPLAVHRAQVKDLPLTVTLDDSMAMMPQLQLSAFPQVAVGARVSLSGNATASAGDLEGEVKPVKPGQAEPVRVTIDAIRP